MMNIYLIKGPMGNRARKIDAEEIADGLSDGTIEKIHRNIYAPTGKPKKVTKGNTSKPYKSKGKKDSAKKSTSSFKDFSASKKDESLDESLSEGLKEGLKEGLEEGLKEDETDQTESTEQDDS